MSHASLIQSLKKQHHLLEDLISRFSERQKLGEHDFLLYDAAIRKVERELKDLKRSLGRTTSAPSLSKLQK